jgi:microcystin-dependent protein
MPWKFFTSTGTEKVTLEETPAGLIVPYAGASAPSGWLGCDGAAVSRSTYSTLFAAIGLTYGSGNGSTTFNLPDLRGRVPVGTAQGYGDRTTTAGALTGTGAITGGDPLNPTTLGSTRGNETVAVDGSQSGLPAHSHSIASGFHNHGINVAEGTSHTHGVGYNIIRVASNPDQLTGPNDNGAIYSSMGSTSVLSSISPGTSGISIQNNGAETGTAHANMMPWTAVNYIIKIR